MGAEKAFLDFDPGDLSGPLWPFHYESLQFEEGCRPVGFRFSKYIANWQARLNGHDLLVTGEGDTLGLAHAKARSELLERSALISYAHQYKSETSNGWAAHPQKDQARKNAILELVERDAGLSQWYSSTPFLELEPSQWPEDILDWSRYELERSEFPRMRILISTRGIGPSVTCLFVNSMGLGVSAHATRITLEESIRAAVAEACRPAHASIRRDHWQDTLKLKCGESNPLSSEAHALYYAYHEPFPGWIFGQTIPWNHALALWQNRMADLSLQDSQFKFTCVLSEPLFVGFAKHPSAFPLRWGITNTEWVSSLLGFKRLTLNANQINKQVHIIS